MADEGQINVVSSLKIEDYYQIFDMHQKSLFLLIIVALANAAIIQIINPHGLFGTIAYNPFLLIIEFIPTFFIVGLIKVQAVSLFVYNLINNRFKITPAANTKYLTGYLRNVSDYIIIGPDKKTVVLKLNSDDFYNKLPEERIQVMADFNSFIINLSETVVLRVINKSLNLSDYFEFMRKNIEDNVIYQFYYSNFVKEYIDISKNIPDYDYYMEIHYPENYIDDQIETSMNLIVSNMIDNLNLSTDPQLLRGDELLNYIKNLIGGEEYRNIYTIPIITDY